MIIIHLILIIQSKFLLMPTVFNKLGLGNLHMFIKTSSCNHQDSSQGFSMLISDSVI